MEDTERLSETLLGLLENGRQERLRSVLEECHPADTAAALRDLPLPHQVTVFRLLNREQAGAVLAELDDQSLLELVRAVGETEISGIRGFFSFLGLATLLLRFLLE